MKDNLMLNLIKTISNILNSNNFNFNPIVPSKTLSTVFSETQNLSVIEKKFTLTNVQSNISFTISAHYKNDYFDESFIEFKMAKPITTLDRIVYQNILVEKIYKGKNEDTEKEFNDLKKHFYNPHIKFPVPAK